MKNTYSKYVLIIVLILILCSIFRSIDSKIIEGADYYVKKEDILNKSKSPFPDFNIIDNFINDMIVPKIFTIFKYSKINEFEELGRVDSEKASTKKGKKNLTAEKKRIINKLNKA